MASIIQSPISTPSSPLNPLASKTTAPTLSNPLPKRNNTFPRSSEVALRPFASINSPAANGGKKVKLIQPPAGKNVQFIVLKMTQSELRRES